MKYLSIIGFLAMVVFFTLWSMYEDSRKRVIHEDFSGELLRWTVEGETDSSRFSFNGDTLNIFTPSTITLWYDHRFNGNYRIRFSVLEKGAAIPDSSVSAWGCFWAATDPEHPDNLFFNSDQRGQDLSNYHSLQLYYTIRQNQDSLRFGKNRITPDSLPQRSSAYPSSVFQNDTWNVIEIKMENEIVSYSVNGNIVKQERDNLPLLEGYFGLYLQNSVLRLTGFEIKLLK